MKNRIKQKLTSSDGISVLFGLLFFLVAAILSAVMLSASVTAIKSVTSDHKTEQNYQNCSSAAATIRDAITDTRVRETIKTKTGTTKETTTSWEVSAADETEANNFAQNYLKEWLKSLADSSTSSMQTTLTIAGIDDLDDVIANVTIRKDDENQETVDGNSYPSYDIDIVFTTGTGGDSCKLTLTLSGECKGDLTTSTYGKIKTTTIDYTWNDNDIMYGDETKEAGS